ncbi:MAG: hypothetical protein JWQ09_668 [Segetibacter sp.]|nr:hypothetical protein [Segetibacter sp.]
MPDKNVIKAFGDSVGINWSNVFNGLTKTHENVAKIKNQFKDPPFNSDLDFVVYGSIARNECTEDSDVDWTLLIDGQADATHLETAQMLREKIDIAGFPQPGPAGMFGRTTVSHDLIHNIGGQEDTNHNLTRRILL